MNPRSFSLSPLGILAGAPQVGKVTLANENAMAASFLSQPLTDYATGWKSQDGKLEALLDFLAPGVRVAPRFEYKVANNNDEFAMIADDKDVRALFGEYALVKTIGDTVQSKTVSKGLTTVLEKDTEMPGDREAKVAWLKRMLLKAECFRAFTLLNAAATNTAKTWNNTATPDVDLMAAVTAFGDAVGVDANRILFGSTAWQKRFSAYAAKAASNMVPPSTVQGLADLLAVDGCLVSSERYTSGNGKAKLVSAATVLVFAGQANASQDDFSTVKRFWTPKAGGSEYVTYVDETTNPELVKITVAHRSQIATTCSTGVQKLTIS